MKIVGGACALENFEDHHPHVGQNSSITRFDLNDCKKMKLWIIGVNKCEKNEFFGINKLSK